MIWLVKKEINLKKIVRISSFIIPRARSFGVQRTMSNAALAPTFCHRRWNIRGRKDDTCLMRLKADLSRDRLSFCANDPRPSVSTAGRGWLQSRAILIRMFSDEVKIRYRLEATLLTVDPSVSHVVFVPHIRGVVEETLFFKYIRTELFIIWSI